MSATHPTVPVFTLGDRLRKAREHAGLEQQQLADRIEVSRVSISNAERGRNRPHRLVITAWALATGVPVEWLRGDAYAGSPADATSRYARRLLTFPALPRGSAGLVA